MKQMKLRRRHHRQLDEEVVPAESITGGAGPYTAVSDDAARLLLRILVLLDEERDEA